MNDDDTTLFLSQDLHPYGTSADQISDYFVFVSILKAFCCGRGTSMMANTSLNRTICPEVLTTEQT